MATYVLVVTVAPGCAPTVGARGVVAIPPGDYLYVGSARRNWEARVARHLRKEKRLRWHIDYILAAPEARVAAVWVSALDQECAAARQLLEAAPVRLPAPRIGASDCRCPAHFFGVGGGREAVCDILRERAFALMDGWEASRYGEAG